MIINITSCSKNESNVKSALQSETTRMEDHVYTEVGLRKYNPPIEVHFVRELTDSLQGLLDNLPDETLNNNRWSNLFEEVLGVHMNNEWVESGEIFALKLNHTISSGEIPDIIKVNADQLRILYNDGLIEDLTQVYEEYATPLTKAIFSQEGNAAFDLATMAGNLMAIPVTGSSIEEATYIWIRTDWLDSLGLEAPRTIDDLLKISKAFTTKDPDQNGEDDTYGLMLSNYLWDPIADMEGFMAGFDAFPRLWVEDESGKLVFGGIQPEVKAALQELQKMYKNGEIENEFYYKNGTDVKEMVVQGKLGMFYGEQGSSSFLEESRKFDKQAEWQAFPIVSGAKESAKVPLKYSTSEFFAVKKGFEHPEVIVKLINLYLEKVWGDTAEFDTYHSNPLPVWQLSPVSPYPARKNLEAFRQIDYARKNGDMSQLTIQAKHIQTFIEKYLKDSVESFWGWERTYGENGAFAILDQYEQNGQFLYDKFTGPPTATMLERESFLVDLQHETYFDIILGNPIDEFDNFIEKWNKLGGEQITKEVNAWYTHNK